MALETAMRVTTGAAHSETSQRSPVLVPEVPKTTVPQQTQQKATNNGRV